MEYDPTPDDIKNLREWIEAIPYLPHNLKDEELKTYFRCFKGSLEKTKAFLDKLYYGRIQYPGILTNYNPLSKYAQIDLDLAIKVPLPKRTKDGSLIIAAKILDKDLDFDPYEIFRMYFMIFRVLVLEDELKYGKVVFITDCQHVKFSQIKKVSPNLLLSVTSILSTIFPYRISGLHAINLPQAAEWIITLFKSVMKSKVADRLYVHKSAEELLDFYPKEILPVDFGGQEESLEKLFEKFRTKLEGYAPIFAEEELELKKLDAIRPKEADEDILVGSFKKLEVD